MSLIIELAKLFELLGLVLDQSDLIGNIVVSLAVEAHVAQVYDFLERLKLVLVIRAIYELGFPGFIARLDIQLLHGDAQGERLLKIDVVFISNVNVFDTYLDVINDPLR